jgi:two-component system OmpR family response regulator
MRLCLIEDDEELARRLAAGLGAAGFVVEHARDAEMALAWPEPETFAGLIVDLGLPGLGGLAFITRWRLRRLSTPILILTARDGWQEKVDGLNAGADDFVVKPARTEEIVARLHALFRRTSGQHGPHLEAGGVTLDPVARSAWRADGEVLNLTQIEFRLLLFFLHRVGRIVPQRELLDHLYPLCKERELNTVEAHVARLRRKIGRAAITTVRGLGYRFER